MKIHLEYGIKFIRTIMEIPFNVSDCMPETNCLQKEYDFQSQNLINMKNVLATTILFLGALFWFVLFALDCNFHKDFKTLMYLLSSIIWWTCGMINFIISCTSKNNL